MERRFKEEVEISLKLFSRIMKFREIHKRLKTNIWANLPELAWERDYFDNIHLNKEYLNFTEILYFDVFL